MLLYILLTATVLDGILTGGGIDRALVAMPAWHQVGPVAWAAFSRHADLGNGLVLYPLEAIGGMILSAAAAVLALRDRAVPRRARIPTCCAAFFTIGGLVVTLKAAPITLGVGHQGDDAALLQQAFDSFEFWGGVRLTSQSLGYLANICSLVAVARA